jgi:hypothetical protein
MRWVIMLLMLLVATSNSVTAGPRGSDPVQEPCCGDGK